MAPPMPRLNGIRSTAAPAAAARAAVSSLEPSSTTSTSKSGAASWMAEIVAAIASTSLKAGTIARLRLMGSKWVATDVLDNAYAADELRTMGAAAEHKGRGGGH